MAKLSPQRDCLSTALMRLMRRFVPVRMRVPIGRLAHATRLHVLNSPLILLLQSEILLQHGRHQLRLQLDVRRLGCLGLDRRRAAIRMAGGDGEVDFLPAEHAVRVRVEQLERGSSSLRQACSEARRAPAFGWWWLQQRRRVADAMKAANKRQRDGDMDLAVQRDGGETRVMATDDGVACTQRELSSRSQLGSEEPCPLNTEHTRRVQADCFRRVPARLPAISERAGRSPSRPTLSALTLTVQILTHGRPFNSPSIRQQRVRALARTAAPSLVAHRSAVRMIAPVCDDTYEELIVGHSIGRPSRSLSDLA